MRTRVWCWVATSLVLAALGSSAAGHLAHLELSPDMANAAGALELLAAAALVGRVFAGRLRRRKHRRHIVLLGAELAGACSADCPSKTPFPRQPGIQCREKWPP